MGESDLSSEVNATTVLPAPSLGSYDSSAIARYALDSVGDGTAEDAVGNFDLTVNGGTSTSSIAGDGYLVDGTRDNPEYAAVSATTINGATEATLTGWVKAKENNTYAGIFGHQPFLDSKGGGLTLRKTNSNRLDLFINGRGGGTLPYLDYTPSSSFFGTWRFIACVWTGTDLQLYIDGTKVEEEPADQSEIVDSGVFEVGRYKWADQGNDYYFDGSIDEVRLYDTALSASEIETLYNNPTTKLNSGVSTDSSGDVVVNWTNNDDSSDGGIDVERSTDGFSTVTTVGSGLSASTTSYTDSTVSQGKTYAYRVERNTDHATATSGQESIYVPKQLFRTSVLSGDAVLTATRSSILKERADTIRADGELNATRSVDRPRSATINSASAVTARRKPYTRTRGATVIGDDRVLVTRRTTSPRRTANNGDGSILASRALTKTRTSTLSGAAILRVRRETTKSRISTLRTNASVVTTRNINKQRLGITVGDGVVDGVRYLNKVRASNVYGSNSAVRSHSEFTEVFPDEQTNELSWDFSFDEPFGFVSEWFDETADLPIEVDAFTVVVDTRIVQTYELGVEYDVDGDGEAEYRTDTKTVERDGQTLTFPNLGEPGQYRLYIQQMRLGDYLRAVTVGPTRY